MRRCFPPDNTKRNQRPSSRWRQLQSPASSAFAAKDLDGGAPGDFEGGPAGDFAGGEFLGEGFLREAGFLGEDFFFGVAAFFGEDFFFDAGGVFFFFMA